MARSTKTVVPETQPANLSPAQIRAGIPKLERRLRELEAVNIDDWNDNIRRDLDALYTRIEETLNDVFGSGTQELKRYNVYDFSFAVPLNTFEPTPPHEWMDAYKGAVADAISILKTARAMLKERLDDMGETPGGQALRAYVGLDLHPEIDRAASKLYRDSHYANAIVDAVKALNGLVRVRSGIEEDGVSLMQKAFSPKNPVLRFNALSDKSDEDEQLGYMMMFSGVVAGLRNPRAHKLIKDDPERALEFIAFVSLLAKLLDGASQGIAIPSEA